MEALKGGAPTVIETSCCDMSTAKRLFKCYMAIEWSLTLISGVIDLSEMFL